jgi:hypothetical protein
MKSWAKTIVHVRFHDGRPEQTHYLRTTCTGEAINTVMPMYANCAHVAVISAFTVNSDSKIEKIGPN